jgi:hypothetical protein
VVASINGDFKIIADIEPYEMRMNVDGVGGWLRYKFEEVETEALPSPLPEHPTLIGGKNCTIFLALSDGVNFIEEGTNTSDNNIYIEQHTERVYIGGDYYLVPNLPSIKCIDFLKSLATLTGRFITIEEGQMRLYSYDKFNEKSDAYDWSAFVVCIGTRKIQHISVCTMPSLMQRMRCKYHSRLRQLRNSAHTSHFMSMRMVHLSLNTTMEAMKLIYALQAMITISSSAHQRWWNL